jgi:oxygen-independent coproporphyrinogen-3 oxidase
MLNALRLKDGVPLDYFLERTGLGANAIKNGLQAAQDKGLMSTNDPKKLQATERGFDFLSDLQELFLPAT